MASFPRLDRAGPEKDNTEQELTSANPFEAGDLIVSYLEQIGVEYVFGIPGGPIEPLYNALARSARRGGPRPIVARHESGAAFMADGYARETGKLGVCCATTGPGVTNMLTGIASAQQDNTPLLLITAQSPLPTFGKGATQESSCDGINTVELLRYCTKYSSLVSHLNQLEWKLGAALVAAAQHPQGPAHLSVPLDLLRAPLPFSQPSYDLKKLTKLISYFDFAAYDHLVARAAGARQIVLLVGERAAGAATTIADLAAHINATIIATPQGKGLISPYHPQFRGVFGLAGHKSAVRAVTDSGVDLVLAIGSSLDELATNGWDETGLMTPKLIHIDSHPGYFSRSPMAAQHVCGDIAMIMERLYEDVSRRADRRPPRRSIETEGANVIKFERRAMDRRHPRAGGPASGTERRANDRRCHNRGYSALRHFRYNEEHKCLDSSTPVKPQRLMYDLSRLFPSHTRFVAEIGNSFLWAIHYLQPHNRRISGRRERANSLFFTGMGFSSMGWAIGGSVGIAMGSPGCPVVCITGDGSFLMSGQEITVAISERLPVIFVVLNDASLGTVKHGQTLAGAELIGHELPRIDYAAMARAMGVEAHRIQSPADMAALNIKRLCERKGPTLLDVFIDPNEAPPLGERLEMLASGK